MLDPNSPIPLYYQLAESLRGQIADGTLVPGGQLPSERELVEQSGVSRMTVRRAIQELQRDGLVKTRQGVGTTVARNRVLFDVANLFAFEQVVVGGRRPQVRVLAQELIVPRPNVAKALGLKAGQRVVHIQRVRIYGGTPLLLESNCFPLYLSRGLEQEDLEVTPLTSLRHDYGVMPVNGHYFMEATTATPAEAELLGLPAGSPLLLIEGEGYRHDGRPVEHFKALYRANRFRFELRTDGGAVQPRLVLPTDED